MTELVSPIEVHQVPAHGPVTVPPWRRPLDAVIKASGWCAAASVFVILVLMLVQSLSRETGWAVSGLTDLVAWFCAAAAFLVMAHAFKHGDFVRVTLLLEKLSVRARHYVEMTALSIGTVATGYLAWWAVRFVWESWSINDMANGQLVVPMWIPQTSFAFGAVLLFLAVADELWIVWQGGRPTFVVAVEKRHAAGDFSAEL